MEFYLQDPTVVPYPDFTPLEDVNILRRALDSSGTDESKIINVLTKRSFFQRQEIITAYKNKFNRDLRQDLASHASGKFQKLMLALLETPFEFLACELEKAMAGLGTHEDVLTEVLCTRSNNDIAVIALAYKNRYGKTIDEALSTEYKLSAEYKDLLSQLLSGIRAEKKEPDRDKAKSRASQLFNAGQEAWSTEKKIFIRLLTHENFHQLRLIFDEYRMISGQAMEEAVKTALSGDVGNAALTIVRCAINRSQYYAETLEAAMKKFRTDEGTIRRIIVSRCEIDLESIKAEYLKLYHKTLYHAVQIETSGGFREAMLSLLGTP